MNANARIQLMAKLASGNEAQKKKKAGEMSESDLQNKGESHTLLIRCTLYRSGTLSQDLGQHNVGNSVVVFKAFGLQTQNTTDNVRLLAAYGGLRMSADNWTC